MLMWWIQVLLEEALKWKNFGVLAVKLENVTERWELVLQFIYKHFSTLFNVDTPILRVTLVNRSIAKLTPLGL